MNEPNWTDVWQAIGAIASVIIAVVVVIQNWRIQTLTHVVSVLFEAHNLNLELTAKDRIPLLRLESRRLFNAGGPHFFLWMENIGRPFHNIKSRVIQGKIEVSNAYWEMMEVLESRKVGTLVLKVTFVNYDEPDFKGDFDFIFHLYWETDNGDLYRQVIRATSMNLVLSPPSLLGDKLEAVDAHALSDF